ncbi:MAG: DUF424 family protein [Methanomassiliicoccaceae archaeon]|nr:DUF424 family protein [Methanomassiliicoccaceae archaeon]
MISARIHTRSGERLLAACDAELLGMSFSEGEKRLNVSKIFYGGEEITEEQLKERMKSVTVMNLVGERTVTVALASGYVSEEMVITVNGVKHAQAVMM